MAKKAKEEPIAFKVTCLMCGLEMVAKGTATDFEVCKCDDDPTALERFNRKLGLIK